MSLHATGRSFFSVLLLLLCAALVLLPGCNKSGCTDPTSLNYDPDADTDDGTCTYAAATSCISIVDNGNGTGTTTWTKNNCYLLEGRVYVNSGQVLTIEAGTVIKGKLDSAGKGSVLIVAKGGRIVAQGTAAEPIVFTAEQDDVADPNDMASNARGLWGGLILLGEAPLNTFSGDYVPPFPDDPRDAYGGTNNADDSGILQYVSVRYGGADIGSNNPINGVTLAGVGSETIVEHVEVYNGMDDGFEWFGGTVDGKWLAAVNCSDDAFDYDQGYRGRGQFWFGLQNNGNDCFGEHDGGTNPENGTPFAKAIISNATYIGPGQGVGGSFIEFKDNAGGEYHNSIFSDIGTPVQIEITSDANHSYNQFLAGNLVFEQNIFYSVCTTGSTNVQNSFGISTPDAAVDSTTLSNATTDIRSTVAPINVFDQDPGVRGGTPTQVQPAGVALSGAVTPSGIWFDQVSYRGAFAPGQNWLVGWTATDEQGLVQ